MSSKSTYRTFQEDVRTVTRYYLLLVEETKSQRLVGSTNEWVLDNYYMISEQEKVLKADLTSKMFRRIDRREAASAERTLADIFDRCHYQVDKDLLFDHLVRVQRESGEYYPYPVVLALLPLAKCRLIGALAGLCRRMEAAGAYHYNPTDKSGADAAKLNEAAQDNLLMMNIFNSLKRLSKVPVAQLIDRVSFSEKVLKAEKAGMYDEMYDRTKDDYRAQIVRMSKRKGLKEYDYVKQLVAAADEGRVGLGASAVPGCEAAHVGWLLFPPKRWEARSRAYVCIVVAATLLLAGLFARYVSECWGWWAAVCWLLMAVPMSQLVIDLFNQVLFRIHKPVNTYKLKFKDGIIPERYATMVIMPTLLKSGRRAVELLEQLELYYLSNLNRASEGQRFETRRQNLYYTLVGDAASGPSADLPWDDEVAAAGLAKVEELNAKYGAPIFNFVYRRRAWSEGEGCWLGFERKRGAILHFNDLLLGADTEEERRVRFRCETVSRWRQQVSTPITFVITLDTDTQLVLYSAQKLIGAMAHPLNRARLSRDGRRVAGGYGIMQPRVNVDVEVTNKSRYAQLFAGLGGLDVYTTASFELYQDIFNEGSFCGKGIYDLAVFQRVLKGAFPQNLILSHDLIEGCHIRCGLINDVELFDDNPGNYIDDAKRHHRWARGDWQIAGWLLPRVRNERGERVKNQVNTIGRWKIFDNLRRSVLSLSLLLALFFGYAGAASAEAASPAWFVLAVMVVVACPIFFFLVGQLRLRDPFAKRYRYYMTLLRGMGVVVWRSVVQFALLPKEAWMYTDAAVRSCYRMAISHRNLLNWIPSDEAAKSTRGTMGDYLRKFWFNYVCAVVLLALAWMARPLCGGWALAAATLFTAAAWAAAPLLMYRIGKPFAKEKNALTPAEREEVRRWAADTWRYFDSLLTPERNYLIPDNYQLNRDVKADYKTSPTNIGYSLTAVIGAAELGLITHREAAERLGRILATVERLEKWNGHLFNWYRLDNLAVLPNFFISTCDSGNFAACLYVVRGYLAAHPAEDPEGRLSATAARLIDQTDFSKLYNPELDVFSIGYDTGAHALLPYHYNNFASEARLTSFMAIAQGDAPYKHWFCLDKTLVQYRGYKGVASWYGTLFEYFMPLIFLPTYRHTLMDETYSFAIRAQRQFIAAAAGGRRLPWGISETAYNELDDAQNYKYHAFGVPYLKFQNTTPDRIVISPYSSLMAIGTAPRAVYENMKLFGPLEMYDDMGFFESYDEEDHTHVCAHYAHHQGMILASLTNYLCGQCLQRYFMAAPVMRSMETLLKEKAQVKPYIDLKVTRFKRYRYSKVQTESDARQYEGVAAVPEIGLLSNGQYTVLLNDRGSGFSRYRDVLVNRYRKISSDHYGTYLFVANMQNDRLWSSTYAPLDALPEKYRVTFASDKVKYLRVDEGIETLTEAVVVKDCNAEIRRYTFANGTTRAVDLELTSYAEVTLATAAEDENHRVFNSMNIQSEYVAEQGALVLRKPVQGARDYSHYVLHKLFAAPGESRMERPEYETSRLKFLGRGRSLQHAAVLEGRRTLSNTVGTPLDPIMSMRERVRVAPGKSASVYLLTVFGKSREQLLEAAAQYADPVDIANAFETASVFNNMRTDLSLLKGAQMRLYNNISKYLLQTAVLGNGRQAVLAKNTLSQAALWRWGISGDIAILLLEIDDVGRSGFAKEIMRAYEYYKVRGLILDVVFVNDAPESQREGLNHFIRTLADTEHLWVSHEGGGRVYILNGDEVSDAERTLLRTVARLTFNTRDGLTLQQQIDRLEAENLHYQDKVEYPVLRPVGKPNLWSPLEFYNQYGGFDCDGSEYVVTNTNTPMPWVNVIANPRFGCVVSSTMAGFTFAFNAQQYKLTGWSNDIVRDNASEMLLINRCQFVPATARHGQGFSTFGAEYEEMRVQVRVFVAAERLEKYYEIDIENRIDRPLEVRLDMVYKLVLGMSEEKTSRFLYSRWDEESNSMVVRNVYHENYRDTRVQFTATERLTEPNLAYPNRKRIGFGIEVPAGGRRQSAFVISVLETPEEQPRRVALSAIEAEFAAVRRFWDDRLGRITVETPDKSLNYMLNHWYLYQVYSARLYARAGFYQVGGATGFRDQLQDVMSILYSDPAAARRQILEHAAHQMAEGDVLHWWHETMRLGARTTFSDDYLWLVYVTHQYVDVTGDEGILMEQVAFCQADPLLPGETEKGVRYAVPAHKVATAEAEKESGFEYAPLYEHLRRSVNRSMNRIGSHGLPLMGCGDWNDGMSRVGAGGKGESVWVAFFLCDLLPKMEQLTLKVPGADLSYCADLADFRARIVEALQTNAWDGGWWLRAFFDNGDPLGSRNNTECQIDLISQAWSILADVATPEQKESVFRETDSRLVNREHEIIQLLAPAFAHSQNNPGYIMRYPEGVRENGGQYTHGAMWYIMAQLKEGRTDMAYFLYSLINPVHRSSTLADALKYQVEPYCIAADIYSNPQHPGRGGWTWYTGSASWAYKTGVENILGLRLRGLELTLHPQIPSDWDSFGLNYRFGKSLYRFRFRNGGAAEVSVTLIDDGQEHLIKN